VTQGAVTDKPDVHGTQSHSLTRQRQSSTNDCTYGYANEDAEGGVVLWLRYQSVTDYGKKAFLKIAVDDFSKIYVNGKLVGETDAWSLMKKIDITAALTPGENIIMVRAEDSGSLPCGLLAELEIDEKTVLKSDGSWLAKPIQAKDPMPEANKNSLSTFQPVIVITPYGGGAWGTRVVAQQ